MPHSWNPGAYTSLQHTTILSANSVPSISRTLTHQLSSPLKRSVGHHPGTLLRLTGTRRPQESLTMRRQQRSYASHTNTSDTSESAAVCESCFKTRWCQYCHCNEAELQPSVSLYTLLIRNIKMIIVYYCSTIIIIR